MSDLQDKINQILSNPEALKQVQSLGEQLGLSQSAQKAEPPKPPQPPKNELSPLNGFAGDDMLGTLTRIAPMLNSIKEDDTARLLNALRPFLSPDKKHRLEQAEKMLKLLKIMPLIKDSGLF